MRKARHRTAGHATVWVAIWRIFRKRMPSKLAKNPTSVGVKQVMQ